MRQKIIPQTSVASNLVCIEGKWYEQNPTVKKEFEQPKPIQPTPQVTATQPISAPQATASTPVKIKINWRVWGGWLLGAFSTAILLTRVLLEVI